MSFDILERVAVRFKPVVTGRLIYGNKRGRARVAQKIMFKYAYEHWLGNRAFFVWRLGLTSWD